MNYGKKANRKCLEVPFQWCSSLEYSFQFTHFFRNTHAHTHTAYTCMIVIKFGSLLLNTQHIHTQLKCWFEGEVSKVRSMPLQHINTPRISLFSPLPRPPNTLLLARSLAVSHSISICLPLIRTFNICSLFKVIGLAKKKMFVTNSNSHHIETIITMIAWGKVVLKQSPKREQYTLFRTHTTKPKPKPKPIPHTRTNTSAWTLRAQSTENE